MADASTKEATTNTTPKSCVEINCDCNTMWSLAQQFSTKRLCVETGEHKGKLIQDYAVRARRIAATYARFYLELEEGGDPKKIGRYYWMALGVGTRGIMYPFAAGRSSKPDTFCVHCSPPIIHC